jgi:predicted acyltransferase
MSRSQSPQGRLESLDAFRGLVITGMLLVNNTAVGENTPIQLVHASFGMPIHFADLVFPWFLLVLGMAIPFSAASCRKRGGNIFSWLTRTARRVALLVLLGCLIDSALAKRPTFDLGVLQLLGLAYGVGAILYLFPAILRALVAALLLLAHWSLFLYFPIPGHPAGVFTETLNAVTVINESFLNPLHLRGLVSVIPTGALALIGSIAGDVLRQNEGKAQTRVMALFGMGTALALAGWAWSGVFAFSKDFWSGSYILFSGGLGLMVLSLFHLLVDIGGLKRWCFPLRVFGANALFSYVTPIMVKLLVLKEWHWTVAPGLDLPLDQAFLLALRGSFGALTGGWIYTGVYIGAWWTVAWILYRRGMFIRV